MVFVWLLLKFYLPYSCVILFIFFICICRFLIIYLIFSTSVCNFITSSLVSCSITLGSEIFIASSAFFNSLLFGLCFYCLIQFSFFGLYLITSTASLICSLIWSIFPSKVWLLWLDSLARSISSEISLLVFSCSWRLSERFMIQSFIRFFIGEPWRLCTWCSSGIW